MHSLDQHVNSLDLVLTFSLTPHLTWISWVHLLNTQMRGALPLFINVINQLWVGVLHSRIFSKEGALTYQRTLVYLMSVSITSSLEISRESVLTTLNKCSAFESFGHCLCLFRLQTPPLQAAIAMLAVAFAALTIRSGSVDGRWRPDREWRVGLVLVDW